MKRSLEDFNRVKDIFVAEQKKDPDVIGIIIGASHEIHGIDPNSDLDIHIILDNACTYRERGNTWMDGIEIEYFKNPPRQLFIYLNTEKSRHTAHLLANGTIAYANNPIIQELVTAAKNIMSTEIGFLGSNEASIYGYHLDDLWKDYLDTLHNEDHVGKNLLAGKLLALSLEIFYRHHRIGPIKDKRVVRQLQIQDSKFATLVNEYGINQHKEQLQKIVEYVANLIGGWRPKEWVLRSGLQL